MPSVAGLGIEENAVDAEIKSKIKDWINNIMVPVCFSVRGWHVSDYLVLKEFELHDPRKSLPREVKIFISAQTE